MSNQPLIPGLEAIEESAAKASQKRRSLLEQIRALESRILTLELEVSLLQIIIEKEERR